ncbi:MAG TPA: ABC transporter ATP-binding protein [Microbacteriaceae bacterium]|nr:ABC transporter ATP-binding protein [Microbacteriaceae bacterium]
MSNAESISSTGTAVAAAPLALEARRIHHEYVKDRTASTAIEDISIEVRQGEVVCVVGPSGCGKSTLLRILAGLLTPTSGEVLVGDELVDGVPRSIGVVFQDYSRSLFAWMTVADNVEFVLRHSALSKSERRERVAESLEAVGLASAASKYPWELSGGMQQRVAIARCLAYRPTIMLMDEPFASVDAQTRFELEDLVLRVRREFDMTILLVTHDIDESVYLSDRVVALTGSPSSVCEVFENDLPWPRQQIETRAQPRFVELRAQVASTLVKP